MNFMLLVLQFLHFLGCYKIYCLNKMSFFPFSLHEKTSLWKFKFIQNIEYLQWLKIATVAKMHQIKESTFVQRFVNRNMTCVCREGR